MIFFVLQQQLENHILVPKIMSRQVGVSAVTVIVALLIGGSLLGHRRRHPGRADRRDPPGRAAECSEELTSPAKRRLPKEHNDQDRDLAHGRDA